MKRRRLICTFTVVWMICARILGTDIGYAETFLPGVTAELPAGEAYETWMQFPVPDTHTPAIDEDGCLNYALAKMTVRYNLPVPETDLFTDSYTYYVLFCQEILSPYMTKMQSVANIYADYLIMEEAFYPSGDMEERMQQTYAFCQKNGSDRSWSYILKMTTASGSDHYVLTDYFDAETQRIYLLDSGSWYIDYLGDEKTVEKGYYITSVIPYHVTTMPGDMNGDFQLTSEDSVSLLERMDKLSLKIGDANHDGVVSTADAVYVAKAALRTSEQAAQVAIRTDDMPLPVATTTERKTKSTVKAFSSASEWNLFEP